MAYEKTMPEPATLETIQATIQAAADQAHADVLALIDAITSYHIDFVAQTVALKTSADTVANTLNEYNAWTRRVFSRYPKDIS